MAADVIDMATGEVLIEANHELTTTGHRQADRSRHRDLRDVLPRARRRGQRDFDDAARRTRSRPQNDALLEIYRKLRPGDPPTVDTATQLFQGMFFDPRKYDFSRVGRMKFNIKMHDKAEYAPRLVELGARRHARSRF